MELNRRMTSNEFDNSGNKYEIYEELYESCENLIKQNERQYQLLDSKEKTIQQLKNIIITIIENID